MIRIITLLSILSVAFCQYPRQRAPPLPRGPPPEQPPPQGPPPQYEDRDYRPQPRNNVIYRPASVHYVNIGAELAGDYKFGYDTGRGDNGQSFREETRLPDGSVQGAYGYVDETGKQRIVKYTAGKDGFKVEGDASSNAASRSAPSRPAPQPVQYEPQQSHRANPAPQQSYRPAPQQAYRPAAQAPYRPPTPQEAYGPPQPVARAPSREEYAPQPAYRAPPAQQSYYEPEPQVHAPRPRSQSRPRYAPEPVQRTRNSEPDYDYPDNDVTERRLAPIDTSLLNYNIGTSTGDHQ